MTTEMAFVKVAEATDIPEGYGKLIELGGRSIALFNAGDGRFHATSPLCPHEDGPLADGWLEADAVVCPWHGYDFDLATGECRIDPDLAVSIYPVRVIAGGVEVDAA